MTPRNFQEFAHTIRMIAGELEVFPSMLGEIEGFWEMVKDGVPYDELLEFASSEL